MSSNALFRQRAVEQAETQVQADVLRLSPSWTRWAYWVILAGVVAGVGYLALAQSAEWAQGPAVVHVEGAVALTAKSVGTVAEVVVEPGQAVQANQLLVSLSHESEQAQLHRLEQEFELQLARSLRDPADQAVRQSLVSLRVERDLARKRLQELSIRAPRAGIVEDIRVRGGQAVAPGDQLLSLSGESSRCSVWALLPGRYRPELRQGAELRFNVHGYRYAQAKTEVSQVGAQVLGPTEVRRYLGNDIGDAIEIDGPVVLAKAALPTCTFESDDEEYRFPSGMSGTSEVRLRSQPLWAIFFPDLRKVF